MSTLLYAQEIEIEKAFTAYENNDLNTAINNFEKARRLINNKPYTIDPIYYTKYLYTLSGILLKKGKIEESFKIANLLKEYEIGPIYVLRNKATKQKVYIMDINTSNRLLKTNYIPLKNLYLSSNYYSQLVALFNKSFENFLTEATNDYERGEYEKAAIKYMNLYQLSLMVGVDHEMYKYYSAVSYHHSGDVDKALEIYLELINKGNFKGDEKNTESTLYGLATSILMMEAKSDPEKKTELVNLLTKAIKKFPKDKTIREIASIYVNSDPEIALNNLKRDVVRDSMNYENWFKLGVALNDKGDIEEAKQAFIKVIKLEPSYLDSYLILSAIILAPDQEILKKVNNNAYKSQHSELLKQRRKIFSEVLPYLEKASELDRENMIVEAALKEAYRVLRLKKKILQK